jgi:hypothetical protein
METNKVADQSTTAAPIKATKLTLPNNLFYETLPYLTTEYLFNLIIINKTTKMLIEYYINKLLKPFGLHNQEVEPTGVDQTTEFHQHKSAFYALPFGLRIVIIEYIRSRQFPTHDKAANINKLLDVLSCQPADRATLIDPNLSRERTPEQMRYYRCPDYNNLRIATTTSNPGVILLCLHLIKLGSVLLSNLNAKLFATPVMLMLASGLITEKNIVRSAFNHDTIEHRTTRSTYYAEGPRDNFWCLANRIGLSMLRMNFITVLDIAQMEDSAAALVVSPRGFYALSKGLLTSSEAILHRHGSRNVNNLVELLSDNGLCLLRQEVFDAKDAAFIKKADMTRIVTAEMTNFLVSSGISFSKMKYAYREHVVPELAKNLVEIYDYLQKIEDDTKLLTTLRDIFSTDHSESNFANLINIYSLIAFSNGWYTLKDIMAIKGLRDISLRLLFSPTGLKCIELGLLALNEFQFIGNRVSHFFEGGFKGVFGGGIDKKFIAALQYNLITKEDLGICCNKSSPVFRKFNIKYSAEELLAKHLESLQKELERKNKEALDLREEVLNLKFSLLYANRVLQKLQYDATSNLTKKL